MQRHILFRKGDRAEYLAQYIISSLAITVPVPRPEDIGIDFHCSLLRRNGDNLRPSTPFNLQIKSKSDVIKNGILIGGLTNGGNWRSHEINQFCQTDTPFLIGVVDLEQQNIDLFSTVTRYFIIHQWKARETPLIVKLIPYKPEEKEDLNEGTIEQLPHENRIPNTKWNLQLGQPIASISIEESEDEDRIEEIKDILEPHLKIDQENAVYSRTGLRYFVWPKKISKNNPISEMAAGLAYGSPNEDDFTKQKQAVTKIIASLLASYRKYEMKDEIRKIEPILDLLPIENEASFITKSIKDSQDFANS